MSASTSLPAPLGIDATGLARLSRTVVGRRTVVSVGGEVDLASTPRIADAIDEAIAGGALELWLDLSRVDFMDSSGAHLLLETQARSRALNRRLAVVCPGGPARRLLELVGMADRLPLYDDRAAAHRAA